MITTQLIEPLAIPVWGPFPLHQMTVDQYESLVESGVFTKHDRFHLINGLLVAKMTKKPPHVVACDLTREALDGLSLAGWHTRHGDPVRLPPDCEPEPDVALVRGTTRDYSDHHPGPADIALVVEVADSSLTDDRKEMAVVYGKAGIPVYWIVNLVDRQVEVYTKPGPRGYRSTEIFKEGQSVPVVIGGQEVGRIAVEDILPSPRRQAKAGGDGA
jgi:Uma2 family endonuclease